MLPLVFCESLTKHVFTASITTVWTDLLQATIQGALGSAPLMLIQSRLRGTAKYAQYEVWGNDILHATAFSIIISAPVGLLVIALLGPVWLKQEVCTFPRSLVTVMHAHATVLWERLLSMSLPRRLPV